MEKKNKVTITKAEIRKMIIDLHYEGKMIYEIAEMLNLTQAYVVDVLERGGYVVK